MGAPSAKALGKQFFPSERVLVVKHTAATEQQGSPGRICTLSFALHYWQAWHGEGAVGDALGCCQEGCTSLAFLHTPCLAAICTPESSARPLSGRLVYLGVTLLQAKA